MNIMDLFRTVPTNTAVVTPAPTGNSAPGVVLPSTQSGTGTAPNGAVPINGGVAPNVGTTDPKTQSPFADFDKLWDIDPKATDPNISPFANVDPAKVMESARKVDFAKAVTPELLTKIQAGGQEGMVALMTALNTVSQQTYGQSALATTKIVEQALAQQRTSFEAALPALVKKLSVNDNLRTENPLLANPAIAPMVEALQSALLTKNPNATAAEIQAQVNTFLGEMGKQFGPKPATVDPSKTAAGADYDWEKFLNI